MSTTVTKPQEIWGHTSKYKSSIMDNNSNINLHLFSGASTAREQSIYIKLLYRTAPFRIVYSIIELHYNALASTISSFVCYIHLNLKFPLTK